MPASRGCTTPRSPGAERCCTSTISPISYGGEPVLEQASFSVGEGGSVSLVGPSGSGKSSLVRAVIGLQQPPSARDRDDIHPAGIGPCSGQCAAAVERRHATDVVLGLTLNGMERGKALAEADTWLDRLGLAGYGDGFRAI